MTGNRTKPQGIVVLYSDIFGLPLPNNKLLADAYAASGKWLVYLPDFFKGDPVPLATADVLLPVDAKAQSTLAKYTGILAKMPSFLLWMTRHKHADVDRECMEWLAELRRATPSTQKIGMVGTCWGGRYALRAALEENMIDIGGVKTPLVDAVVALHPSNLSIPADVENTIVPVTIGWGKNDQGVSFAQKSQVEEAHEKAKKEGKKVTDVVHQVYTPGRHGFSVRGNPDDPEERKALEDSEKQVLEWMDRWL